MRDEGEAGYPTSRRLSPFSVQRSGASQSISNALNITRINTPVMFILSIYLLIVTQWQNVLLLLGGRLAVYLAWGFVFLVVTSIVSSLSVDRERLARSGKAPGLLVLVLGIYVIGELVSPWLLTWWIVTRSPLSGSADAHKWTLEEYTALVERVEQNYAGLSTRYATGPEGKQTAQMQAAVSPEGAFVLTLIQPSGAIRRFDEASGQSVATGEAMVIVMRDHDRDGRPDDVQTTPTGEPLFEETVTPDGFTELRDAPEHAPFFVVWSGSVEALVASQVRRPPEHVVQ